MTSPSRPGPGRPLATEQPSKVADVALELFLKHGYDATPMSLVARECGLTKAGIYHHFESKEQLLYYLHKRHIDRLLLPMIEEAAKIIDPEERLRRFLSDYAMLLTHDPTPRLLISETKRLSPEHTEEIRDAWRRGLNLVRDAVSELQALDSTNPHRLNPTYAAFAAIGMTSWICNWFDYGHPETGPDVAATMVTIFLGGLSPPAQSR
jgi:AcrR family transcriptional regulator